ncbi:MULTISPECIES: hypothetical protein [Agrobacterium]|uniref:hypothetical protein n=1 Tax=Agrobacterium TaxID=357 RepID=UPI00278B3AC0|nr:hypothetical protein [Agrobacterium sp. SORGH_AS_0745]MDP9762480.1 hypothetical protein [Agrobacterium tumefaciens]MDQ1220399.1 hypothetical protein [Agrobacterium sp. SORGH_AS_0745]
MNQSQPNRFAFHTQCPRDDGCGVFVLQMLTGMSYDDVAAMIDWGDKSAHYTSWNDLCGVLAEIGWSIEVPIKTSRWSDIQGSPSSTFRGITSCFTTRKTACSMTQQRWKAQGLPAIAYQPAI